MDYNGGISQTSRVKDSKYIFKEIKLYYLEYPSLVNYEKQKHARAHIDTHTHTYNHMNTHIHTHTQTHTHTHAHTHTRTHTYTHAHKDTLMHASVRSPDLPDNVKEAGSIELFKQILKTVVFS